MKSKWIFIIAINMSHFGRSPNSEKYCVVRETRRRAKYRTNGKVFECRSEAEAHCKALNDEYFKWWAKTYSTPLEGLKQ